MPLINLQHGIINKSNVRVATEAATEAYPESLSGRMGGDYYASQNRFFGNDISQFNLNRKKTKSNTRDS